jgi:membrane protein
MLDAPPAVPPQRPPHLRPLDTLRTAVRAVPQAVDGYLADRCGQYAAGIAYRVLFSLAPLAIVLVAILGAVLQDDSLRARVIHEVVAALPLSDKGGVDVTKVIEKLAAPVNLLGLISLFVFGWAASGMMGALRTGLEVAMRVEQARPAARAKLVDLLLVVGTAALVLATVLVNVLVQVVTDGVERPMSAIGLNSGILQALVRHGFPLLLSTIVVLLLYRFVPARHLRFGDALAGAIFTALLLLAISLGSGWIYARTTNLSVVYGSLTAALVFLYSVYLYASALLLGAEVAAAWSHPGPPTDEPFRAKVRRLLLGLFVHRDPPAPRDERRPPGN